MKIIKIDIFYKIKQYQMTSTIELEIIGYVAGFLTTICMVPQLWEIFSKKSARDVSLMTYFILLVGEVLWTVYGVFLKDLRIILPNVVSSIIGILIICFAGYYRNNTQIND